MSAADGPIGPSRCCLLLVPASHLRSGFSLVLGLISTLFLADHLIADSISLELHETSIKRQRQMRIIYAHIGPGCFVCDTTAEEERTSNDGGFTQGDDELSSSVSTRRQTWRSLAPRLYFQTR
ncbi:hypothetical protein SISNIDRAFT_450190, partial [Sistotremastrum niveocremeum HHB9708]